MSRLITIANTIRENGIRVDCAEYLERLDARYDLRKRAVKREHKQVLDEDGNPVKTDYMPHIALTPSGYARTWKVLEKAKKIFDCPDNGTIWESRLLLGLEHILRYLEKKDDAAGWEECKGAIDRLMNPLPKSEYLKPNKQNKEENT